MGPCLPHSEDSRNGSCSRYRRHDCGEDWETGDAGVSGAGRAQGAVPALSGWERLRVTISLMRADRPAGRESWARPDPGRSSAESAGKAGGSAGGLRPGAPWRGWQRNSAASRDVGAQEALKKPHLEGLLGVRLARSPTGLRAPLPWEGGPRRPEKRTKGTAHSQTQPRAGGVPGAPAQDGRGPHSASRGHPNPQTWRWGLPFTRGALDRARN